MKKKKQNIEEKILKKIKSGEIKMTPRWRFVMKIWEGRVLWLALILAASLSISAIVYFIKIYNPKELIEFESIGWQVFWEDFPYYWLFGMLLFWTLAMKLWLNLGNNYRKTNKKKAMFIGMILSGIIAVILFLN
jgi:accessory gene regulator protein AgrB